MSWSDSETKSFEYIKSKINLWSEKDYKFKEINLIPEGGSDSNLPDIKLTKKNKFLFNIEIKMHQAQIGQFVIFPDHIKKNFNLSDKNKGAAERTLLIKKYMDKNYETFKNPTQKGIVINCSNDISYSCVNKYFIEKKILFIICNKDEQFKIININNFSKFFDIKAIYRKKKSGSQSLPIKIHQEVIDFFKTKFRLNLNKFFVKNNKLFLKPSNEILEIVKTKNSEKRYFKINEYKIYLSDYKKNKIEIKKTSSTNNPNVIFEIKLKDDNLKDDLEYFKEFLIND